MRSPYHHQRENPIAYRRLCKLEICSFSVEIVKVSTNQALPSYLLLNISNNRMSCAKAEVNLHCKKF